MKQPLLSDTGVLHGPNSRKNSDVNHSTAVLRIVNSKKSNTLTKLSSPTDAVVLKKTNCDTEPQKYTSHGAEEFTRDVMDVLDRRGMTQSEEYTKDVMDVLDKGLKNDSFKSNNNNNNIITVFF